MKGKPTTSPKETLVKAIRVGHDGRDVYFVAHLCSAIPKVLTKKNSDNKIVPGPIRRNTVPHTSRPSPPPGDPHVLLFLL